MYAGNKRYYLIMAYLDNSWMGHKIKYQSIDKCRL